MMSVHTSPSKRMARPTGWVAHVSDCSVFCEWSVVFIVQVYDISSVKNNLLDNRKFLLYTDFHKESIDRRVLAGEAARAPLYLLPSSAPGSGGPDRMLPFL